MALYFLLLVLSVNVIPLDSITFSCKCVPFHLCADKHIPANLEEIMDIRSPIDICSKNYEVCCKNPVEFIPQIKTTIKKCGYQYPYEVNTRIIPDSENTVIGEIPWAIVILIQDKKRIQGYMYKCGASLIHPEVVLTAAHCVKRVNHENLIIRAGEWDSEDQQERFPHQDHIVKEIKIHPKYDSRSLKNDIALLFLVTPVVLTEHIGLICLPETNMEMDGETCLASGWGASMFRSKTYSTTLKKIDLPIVKRDECVALLRRTRLGGYYQLHNSFICAGGEKNKDACKGDGGSPLVCRVPGERNRFFQLGIVAWGIGCGENKTPGVYVNVPIFVQWIDEQMISRGLDISVYKY